MDFLKRSRSGESTGTRLEGDKGGSGQQIPRWKLLLPIVVFSVYLALTVLLFAFGPWHWPVKHGPKVYTFLALAQLMLLLGYLSATFKKSEGYHAPWRPERLLQISIILNLLLFLPTSYTRAGHLFPDVLAGIMNPGRAYNDSFEWRATVNPVVEYVRILLAPLLSLLIPLTMFYWTRLKTLTKVGAVVSILAFVSIYVAMGTNKGLADLWLMAICTVLGAYLSGRIKFEWKHIPIWIGLNVRYVGVFLSFFTAGMISRAGSPYRSGYFGVPPAQQSTVQPEPVDPQPVTASGTTPGAQSGGSPSASGTGASGASGVLAATTAPGASTPPAPQAAKPVHRMLLRADDSNFLVRYLPPKARSGMIALSSYLTQGYYALSLSLDKPFVPMYGVGNSMFLSHNAAKLMANPAIEKMTYPARIEADGWNATAQWSSIYPWIASDVSFPGTLLVIFLIGRMVVLAWLDTLEGSNPFAVVVFANCVIMLAYFPANNQLLQSGEGLVGFYAILVLWLLTRRKYRLSERLTGRLGES